ncbi:MarR family winged helix-turn-helix transcriptional regulator [Pseudonocardia benzenivorans]|uniref:MarR family winged helix-turn-helix transcriptional regulator n=1 Tax=Pseudonocardia benzenivorans TaxID=228005 RepID=A0ABW3VGA3_9PSEU
MTSAAISSAEPSSNAPAGPDADDLAVADALAHEVSRLLRLVQRTSRYSGPADLDRATFHVLVQLATGVGPQRSGDIAEALCTDPSTVSRRVAALVKQGLIERRADPDDGRASLLAVTDAGHAALEQSRLHKAWLVAGALAGWPIEKRRALVALLADFSTDYQQHELSTGPVRRHGGGN